MFDLKMANDADVRSIPLDSIPTSVRKVLSNLLNPTKVIPAESNNLPRDWRGLASLLNIPSEITADFETRNDPTAEVIKSWTDDPNITVGDLLDNLEKLDRFDVYEDVVYLLRELSKRGELQYAMPVVKYIPSDEDLNLLTYDDRPGRQQLYDAFVLYDQTDVQFVKDIKNKLGEFKICTKDVLLPGYTTEQVPITKLMTERCRYIIIVYSPEFLERKENEFYRDYAHALSVQSSKLIPVMYRECTSKLPHLMRFYFWLYYNSDMYNFWDKLRQSLDRSRTTLHMHEQGTNGFPKRNGVRSISATENSSLDSSDTMNTSELGSMSTAIITDSIGNFETINDNTSIKSVSTVTPIPKKKSKNSFFLDLFKPLKKTKKSKKIKSNMKEEIML